VTAVVFAAFQWLERTRISLLINESLWAFAVIEAIHLLALAVIGGAVLVVALRLLGLAFQEQRVGDVARVAQKWFLWSLAAMLVTGFLLFLSLAASKYYVHTYFWVKMYFLAAAMIFAFTVRHWIVMGNEARANSALGKLVAVVSIILWSGVGFAGKAIGYIS
jgi:hypothetical protein